MSLHFSVIDRISSASPQGAQNEDAIGATRTAAWVIDGATGVSDGPALVAGQTDAAWLASQMSDELHKRFERENIDPVSALAEVDSSIQAKFTRIKSLRERTAGDQPSAAFALAVLTNDVAHLIGIADCRIIVEDQGGDVNDFNPSDLGKIESLIINERRRLEATYPDEDAWPRLQPFIRSFRELANLQPGYSVVHPTRSWCTRTRRLTREAAELRHLMVVSDGLYRLVDVFHVINAEGLLRRALQDGLEMLCAELREMELKDGLCSTYPRVKTCDDASAVLLRVL